MVTFLRTKRQLDFTQVGEYHFFTHLCAAYGISQCVLQGGQVSLPKVPSAPQVTSWNSAKSPEVAVSFTIMVSIPLEMLFFSVVSVAVSETYVLKSSKVDALGFVNAVGKLGQM